MAGEIEISRDIYGINKLTASMRELKIEYTAITNAQKYDAQSTELLTAKKENLRKQLEVITQQTNAYTQAQANLKQQLDAGTISVTDYDKEIAKLEQSKTKLNYTSIALNGQLNSLSGSTQMTATSMKDLASSTDKSTEANKKSEDSWRKNAKEMRQARADAMIFLGVINGLANVWQGLTDIVNDWNAVNADGTPKMNEMQKVMKVLSITTMAASIAAMLFKNAWLGIGIGALIAGLAVMSAKATEATNNFANGLENATGGISAYGGASMSVNRITTQRTERTVNYNMNMNISSNKDAGGLASNPQFLKAVTAGVNRNLGGQIKR